jgi:hypothetical protein
VAQESPHSVDRTDNRSEEDEMQQSNFYRKADSPELGVLIAGKALQAIEELPAGPHGPEVRVQVGGQIYHILGTLQEVAWDLGYAHTPPASRVAGGIVQVDGFDRTVAL